MPDILRVAVDEICRYLKWPVGHALVPSEKSSQELVSTGIWRLDDPKRYAPFRRVSGNFPNIERGLIGRAIAAKKAIQAADIADKTIKFIFLDEAKAAGLKSGIVLPVMLEGRVSAVLEFYTTARIEKNSTLLLALDQIARHIAHVAERIRARSAQRRLADAIEGIGDGVALFDQDERLVLFNRRYAAEVAKIADVFKPGLTFEALVRALARSGYYGPVDEAWIQARLRQFRAREDAEYAVRGAAGRPNWRAVRHLQTADGGTLITLSDITARKQAEAERESTQRLLQTALDSMTDGVALFDQDERLVLFNEGYVRKLDYLRDIIKPGLHITELVGTLVDRGGYVGAGKNFVDERVRRFRALEATETHLRDPDGQERWSHMRHYRTGDGGTLLIRTDITERKRAEAELMSARQLLQTALDSMTDGAVLYDKDERLVLFNEGYARGLSLIGDILKPGLTLTEEVTTLMDRGKYLGVGGDWVKKRIRAFRALEPVESRQRDSAGNERWFSSLHYRTRDGGTFMVRADITERKQAEAELVSTRQLLQTALDSMTDGVALFDQDERLVLFNKNYIGSLPQVREFLKLGQTFAEIVGHLVKQNRYLGKGKDWIETRIREFRALEPTEVHVRDPNGREHWADVRHYRTRDGGTFLVRTDITERKRAEAELESSRQLLQTALDSMADGVALFDKDERLVLFNMSFERNLDLLRDILKPGLRFPELIGVLVERDGYVGVDRGWVGERIRQFRALEPVEICFRDSAGIAHWGYVRHYRTRDGGTFLVRTDITERKRVEAELESSQRLLQTALDSMTDGVALFDQDERLVLFNEGYVARSPALRDFVKPGKTITEIVTHLTEQGVYGGGDKSWVAERLRHFRALEPAEFQLRDPGGGERWARVHLYRTRDGGTFLVRADVTERKRAEAELESAQRLLQTALDSMTDGVALFDKDERLVLWSKGYIGSRPQLRDFVKPGLTFAEIVGHLAEQGGYIDPGNDWMETRVRKFRALESTEVHMRDPGGRERWAILNHYRTRDGGTLLVRTDVTERMRAIQEIERARVEAENANAAKDKFLASMSHELRTPLNAILGFAQMIDLGMGRMTEARLREYLAIVLKSGQHLLDLVVQILDLSSIDQKESELNIQTLSPAPMVQVCMDMLWEDAKQREVEIIDHTGAPGPDVQFRGDATRVRQVMLNLLSNAVKYNRPGGKVTVTCAANGDGMIRFAVADTGHGIPSGREHEVFQPFHRLGREASNIVGSGIGLALARTLVQRMGGSIGFESAPGQGSTFWFELPEAGSEPGERA